MSLPLLLPPCDPEVLEHGIVVFITSSITSLNIEYWVKKVAEISGQKVDWHWGGNKAQILAVGDLDKVRDVIFQLLPEHDVLMLEARRALDIVDMDAFFERKETRDAGLNKGGRIGYF